MSNLAVIPARGGSTRLKGKNIYPLGGKPLIRWTVEAVLRSQKFDQVVISTDNDMIYHSVSDLNVTRHMRPHSLATTQATVLSAMIDLMNSYSADTFSYFLPTCPFIDSSDIINGIDLLNSSHNTDFVVSMTEFPETIQLACQMSNQNDVLPITDNLEQGITNSKFIKKYFKPSGAFYMAKWAKLLEHKNFFKGNVKGVIIPKERSIDINDIYDIKMAESLLK